MGLTFAKSEWQQTRSLEGRGSPVRGLVSWSRSQASIAARSYTCQCIGRCVGQGMRLGIGSPIAWRSWCCKKKMGVVLGPWGMNDERIISTPTHIRDSESPLISQFHGVVWRMFQRHYAIMPLLALAPSPDAGSLPLLHMIMKLVCVFSLAWPSTVLTGSFMFSNVIGHSQSWSPAWEDFWIRLVSLNLPWITWELPPPLCIDIYWWNLTILHFPTTLSKNSIQAIPLPDSLFLI